MATKNVMSFSLGLFLAVMLFHGIIINVSEAAITCTTVDTKAAACVMFVTGKTPKPSTPCCSGLQELVKSVKSVDDKKDICRCLKTAVAKFTGVQDKFLSQIPTSCKIKVGFPVSLNTNCEAMH